MRTGYALRPVSLYNTVHTDSFTATIIIVVIIIIIIIIIIIEKDIEKVSKRANVTEIQKICMLGSAQILKKVLSI